LGPHDIRDGLVDFVRAWGDKAKIPACRFVGWVGLSTSKFHDVLAAVDIPPPSLWG
jgi:hypothetical protein